MNVATSKWWSSMIYTQSDLEQFGVEALFVHRTWLKEQMLDRIPKFEPFKNGREVWLAYTRKVGEAIATACEYNDALIVSKAAKIVQKQMLEHEKEFNGALSEGSSKESVPPSLLEFVSVLLNDGDIKSQLEYGTSSVDLVLAQLLHFNCYQNPSSSTFTRHSKSREPQFSIYVGLLVYAKTRKCQLIDILH